MSTKTCDAYEVATGKLEHVFIIKQRLQKLHKEWCIEFLTDKRNVKLERVFFEAKRLLDSIPNKEATLAESNITDLINWFDAYHRAGFNDIFNLSASFCFYFDNPSKTMLVQTFGINKIHSPKANEYINYLVKAGKLKDFHYQDQSDPPDDIPKKEFERRGKIWNRIFQDSPIPIIASLSVDLFNGFDILYDFQNKARDLKNQSQL